jgi:hypothetical protein
MLVLATKPHVQQWLAQEMSDVAAEGDEWNYGSIFPRLIRCAVLIYLDIEISRPLLMLLSSRPFACILPL